MHPSVVLLHLDLGFTPQPRTLDAVSHKRRGVGLGADGLAAGGVRYRMVLSMVAMSHLEVI